MAFERENRYVVVKRSDIDAYLSKSAKEQLYRYLSRIGDCRGLAGRTATDYVVVGDDWPMYEQVWRMIEAWVSDDSYTPPKSGARAYLYYEVQSSIWAGSIRWKWGQALASRYFAWKTSRKYNRLKQRERMRRRLSGRIFPV